MKTLNYKRIWPKGMAEGAKEYLDSFRSAGDVTFCEAVEGKMTSIVLEAELKGMLYTPLSLSWGAAALRNFHTTDSAGAWSVRKFPIFVIPHPVMDNIVATMGNDAIDRMMTPETIPGVAIESDDEFLVAQLVDARAEILAGSKYTWKVQNDRKIGVFTFIENHSRDGLTLDGVLRLLTGMVVSPSESRRRVRISCNERDGTMNLGFTVESERIKDGNPVWEHFLNGAAIYYPQFKLWNVHTLPERKTEINAMSNEIKTDTLPRNLPMSVTRLRAVRDAGPFEEIAKKQTFKNALTTFMLNNGLEGEKASTALLLAGFPAMVGTLEKKVTDNFRISPFRWTPPTVLMLHKNGDVYMTSQADYLPQQAFERFEKEGSIAGEFCESASKGKPPCEGCAKVGFALSNEDIIHHIKGSRSVDNPVIGLARSFTLERNISLRGFLYQFSPQGKAKEEERCFSPEFDAVFRAAMKEAKIKPKDYDNFVIDASLYVVVHQMVDKPGAVYLSQAQSHVLVDAAKMEGVFSFAEPDEGVPACLIPMWTRLGDVFALDQEEVSKASGGESFERFFQRACIPIMNLTGD